MPTWDPGLYLQFGDQRLRPAVDLLSRVPLESPETVYDLGCGAGAATRLLKQRWPQARVTGLDGSAAMLERARAVETQIQWRQANLETWEPDAPADLLFSNAVFHWLDGHETRFPRLLSFLKPGGALAIQMPSNFGAPSHTSITAAIRSGPWRAQLEPHLREFPVAGASDYYGILRPHAASLDVWETVYLHVLYGDNPVAEWTRGTALRPYLDRLDEAQSQSFLEKYGELVRAAYPQRSDGATLLPFKRVFLLAVR